MEKYTLLISLIVMSIVALIAIAYTKRKTWKVCRSSTITGFPVKGDKKMPPTKWYNHWYLVIKGWRTVMIFDIVSTVPYYVGFKSLVGQPLLSTRPQTSDGFAVKVGHEDVTFFAVDTHGREIVLHCVERCDVHDPIVKSYPLL